VCEREGEGVSEYACVKEVSAGNSRKESKHEKEGIPSDCLIQVSEIKKNKVKGQHYRCCDGN
jgi:hypothetical protein